jgi:hypothetical protein
MKIKMTNKKIEKKVSKILDTLIDMRDSIEDMINTLEYIEQDFSDSEEEEATLWKGDN